MQLNGPAVEERFDFVPQQTGEFEFAADVEHLEGQVVDQGNHARRDATVIDDFLRLMYVEYEPTWEWRFIKEVFHRDPLVGMRRLPHVLAIVGPEGAHDQSAVSAVAGSASAANSWPTT